MNVVIIESGRRMNNAIADEFTKSGEMWNDVVEIWYRAGETHTLKTQVHYKCNEQHSVQINFSVISVNPHSFPFKWKHKLECLNCSLTNKKRSVSVMWAAALQLSLHSPFSLKKRPATFKVHKATETLSSQSIRLRLYCYSSKTSSKSSINFSALTRIDSSLRQHFNCQDTLHYSRRHPFPEKLTGTFEIHRR